MNLVWPASIRILFFLPVFLLLAYLVFYLPGFLIINRSSNSLRDDEKILFSLSLGFILFLLSTFILGLLGLRNLTLPLYLLITVYALKTHQKNCLPPFSGIVKQRAVFFLLLVGTLVEGMINFPSSLPFKNGHLYWSSQGHDGLWHVAVIEEIKKNFPPNNPLYAGESLYNYHYFVDVIIGEFNRIFPFFSSLDLYFRYFSLIISFLMGLATYSLLTTWKKNKSIGLLGIFFTYFVGSFGYIILVVQGRGFFGGETIFWAAQGNTIIGNPPHAIGYILLPTFFLALYYYLKTKQNLFFISCFLLAGFLVGFKVSAAFVLLSGLSFASLFALIFKKGRGIILLTGLVGLSNLITFKTITKAGESLLMFLPWWFIRTMIVVPDRVNWMDLELRRQFYAARGGIRATLRIIEFETIAFLLFLIGNLGTRVIGFWEIGKSFIKKTVFQDPLETTMIFAMLTGFIVPIFFVQKGVVYNLIQFMQYFLLIFGFFAAVSLYNFLSLFKYNFLKAFVFICFFLFSIPTVIGNLKDFYGKNPLAIISNQEIKALAFLKSQTTNKDIILTKPFNPYSHGLYKSQPWPIYAWDSTGYVSAYTGRQTYYTDEGQMKILWIKGTEERLAKMNDFFDPKIETKEKTIFLKNEKITFIYLRNDELNEKEKEALIKIALKNVFSNDEVTIYSFNPL